MPSAVKVPYRSTRPMHGRAPVRTMSGLAGDSKKRNWNAFNSAFPGTTVNSAGNYVLPAKFGSVVINQGQLDDLDGTWYGATFHPDGDQAGWQQKFDAVLKAIGAFNAYYGTAASIPPTVSPPQIIAPTPIPLPQPVQSAPAPTPAPTIQPVPPPASNLPTGLTLGAQIGFTTDGTPVFSGSDGHSYVMRGGVLYSYAGQILSTPGTPAVPSQPVTLPATSTSPAITVNVPPTVAPDNTSALIQQLMSQGASQQQAFTAALQSLAAQGVNTSAPAVQQQVASDVQAASQPQEASTMYLAVGAVALIGFGILMSNRKKRR